MRHQRLWLCIVVVGGIHLWLLWHVPVTSQKPIPVKTVFDVALQEVKTESAPLMPEPTPPPEEPPPEREQPPLPAKDALPTQALTEDLPNTVEDQSSPIQPRLNLERPKEWEQFHVPDNSADSHAAAFRPDFFEALENRRAARARADLLASRGVARTGMAAEAYNALTGPLASHLKTADGCFSLRSDITGDVGGDTQQGKRWWRSKCREALENPLQMPALEYDALGRALGH